MVLLTLRVLLVEEDWDLIEVVVLFLESLFWVNGVAALLWPSSSISSQLSPLGTAETMATMR